MRQRVRDDELETWTHWLRLNHVEPVPTLHTPAGSSWPLSSLVEWLLGSGPMYQILSRVFARCATASQKTYGHARIARDSRMALMAVGFLTRATCKKVWHKSYTSGHCLGAREGVGAMSLYIWSRVCQFKYFCFWKPYYSLLRGPVEPGQSPISTAAMPKGAMHWFQSH